MADCEPESLWQQLLNLIPDNLENAPQPQICSSILSEEDYAELFNNNRQDEAVEETDGVLDVLLSELEYAVRDIASPRNQSGMFIHYCRK